MRETNYSFMQKNVNKPLNSNDTDQLIIFAYQTFCLTLIINIIQMEKGSKRM